jgi:membrane associated rhomboid family serine protease
MAGIFSSYTSKIMILNVILFIIALALGALGNSDCSASICKYIALQPAAILSGKYLWTIITSIFMHASFTHLFVNMFSLFFIGTFVEKLIGKRRFLIFYILAGIFASLFWVFVAGFFGFGVLTGIFGSSIEYGVGASGAIFGLLGLLAILTPKNRVFLLAGPLIAIIADILFESAFPSIASVLSILVTIYIFASLILMFNPNPRTRMIALPISLQFWILPIIAIVPLIVIGLFIALPIGNMAHLGGLIAGLGYGYYLRKKYPKKAQLISRIFSK